MTSIPILGFIAYGSGVGKTTLLLKIIPLLKAEGLRIGMIKHAHHSFDIDYPQKDSYRLRQAGADQMLIASRQRWALMVETTGNPEAHLAQILPHLDHDNLDLVLVEGFKHEVFPKLEVHRPSLGYPLLFPTDNSIIAIASDSPVETTTLPVLDMNQPAQIVTLIHERILLK